MVDDGQSGDDTCIFPGLPYLKPIGQVTTALWVLFGFSKSRYCSERELSHFLELIKIELDLFYSFGFIEAQCCHKQLVWLDVLGFIFTM